MHHNWLHTNLKPQSNKWNFFIISYCKENKCQLSSDNAEGIHVFSP